MNPKAIKMFIFPPQLSELKKKQKQILHRPRLAYIYIVFLFLIHPNLQQ